MTDFGEPTLTTPDEIAEEQTQDSQEERKAQAKEAWDSLIELAYGTNREGASHESVCESESASFTQTPQTQEQHQENTKEEETEQQLSACACKKCEGFESGEPKTRCACCGCDILDHIASVDVQDTLLSDDDDFFSCE